MSLILCDLFFIVFLVLFLLWVLGSGGWVLASVSVGVLWVFFVIGVVALVICAAGRHRHHYSDRWGSWGNKPQTVVIV
jgi:hypothetical protein